ncbi:hypothetical protein BJ944DRAFT_274333 [Cunninghamella echinulata]|nr:hypothetical protein BJ944DRAFT_274333 [Cunninghamella echinulata]
MEPTTDIQQNMISYNQYHINDDIEGKMITVDEWIARELERIENKKEPRYCRDYEALIEVIEDISRLPAPMVILKNNSNHNHFPNIENDSAFLPPSSSSSYILSSPHLSTSSILLLSPLPPFASSSSSSPSTSTSPSILLDHAFITLLEYCWDQHYSPHHPYPIHLLLDMEKMILFILNQYNNHNHSKPHPSHFFYNNNNIRPIQIQLNHIIQIQSDMTIDHTLIHSPWFSSSKMIQQWAASLSTVNEGLEWQTLFMTGINAYHAAKSKSSYSSLDLPSLPFSSSFPYLSSSPSSTSLSINTYTMDHLEMLMQQITI